MRQLLLRVICFLLLLIGLSPGRAVASHLLGGEMRYQYLDANGPATARYRYRVTVLVYLNWECPPAGGSSSTQSNVPDGRCNIFLNIYDKATRQRIVSTEGANTYPCTQVSCSTLQNPIQNDQQQAGTFRLPRISNPSITPPQPGGCSIPPGSVPPVRLARYEAVVNLPLAFDGYYAVYTDGTRNFNIDNLQNPSNQNQTLFVEMAPPLLPNSSPTFSDTAVVVICQGDTSILVNNAVDPDGDRLIYSFSTPYNGNMGAAPTFIAPPSVTYATAGGYSATTPFGSGPGNYAFLNASNGISRYATSRVGRYVVAVEVKEYRTINGAEVLIGATRREIQLVSRTCSPNNSPQFTAATTSQPRLFTVEEGQPVSFNLGATDPDGNPINLRVNSVLLDGSGPFNATFAGSQGTVLPGAVTGSATVQGTGAVNGQFVFNTQCGNGRATPYDVVVTATDVACGAKSVADVFQIQVTKAVGPTSISGNSVICDRAVAQQYTAGGPTASSYRWTAQGGTIQGPATNNTVQVLWTGTGAGRLVLRGVSAFGCPTDSVVRIIDVRPAGALAVTPTSAVICAGASTTLTATGGTTYTWTASTGQTFAGNTITVSPTTTTTYSVSTSDGICTTTRQVTVTVNPAAVANAGPDAATCSGTATVLGSAALTGYTYQWSPANGLNNSTSAQPTLVLGNTTNTPQTYTYLVTATTAQGCVARDSVRVTINPAAAFTPSPDQVICSGGVALLGSPVVLPVVGPQTYQWSPATGLSAPTAPVTQVTLTNFTSAPIISTYILTVTTANGCVGRDTVRVTVNPAAVANAGPDRATCSGISTSIGSASLTGYSYQWSPAAGLSSATAASPTLTLTNTTGTPQQLTYILTATTPQGCVGRDTVRITLNPAAVANAGPDRAVCSGTPTSIGSASLSGYSYQWSPATGLSSATAANPTVTLTNTGSTPQIFTYIVTATTANSCVNRDTVRVTINPAAVATAGTDRAVCSGETTTLGAASLVGYTYQWSPATGLSSATAANPTFTLTNTITTPQVLTYTVTATTAEGCVAQSTVRVTLNPAAVANAGPDATLCDRQTTTLGSAALTGYRYQWSPAANLSSATTARPVFTAVNTTQAPLTLTYIVTATTAQNCVARDTVRILVNPRPLPDSIQGSASVCPTVQGVAYSIRAPRSTAYQWLVTGGTIASGQGTAAITVNWGGASNSASVQAFRRNAEGCSSDTVRFPVRINQQLVTQRPTGPLRVCLADGPFTYQTQLTNGSTYGWQIVGGTQLSTSQNTVQVNFTRPGIAKLVVTESSNPAGGRCLGQSDTLYVTVLPSPASNLAISGPARACASQGAVQFTLAGTTGSTYAWTVNGAPQTVTAGTLSVPSAVGTYTITARETNSSLCAGPVFTKTFVVVPPLAIAGPASYCPASRTGLRYSTAALSGGQYQWTITGGTITSGQGTPTVTVDVPAGAANATLSVSETTSTACAATFTIRPDNATVALNVASVDLQDDRKINLALNVPNNTGNANRVQILRRVAGSTSAFANVGNVPNTATTFVDTSVDADAAAYEYRVELTNACGDLLASTQHTTIRTQALAAEGGAGRDEGKVTVSWNAYQGFAVQQYRLYRRAANGTAELVQTVAGTATSVQLATSSAGFDQCFRIEAVGPGTLTSSSNEACVQFANDLVFYNVVTPNGDNLNDQFIIKNVELYPGNSLAIFNRWGKEVYKTSSYRNTFDASSSPAGVYYYLLTLPDGRSFKGWFDVVK
ncbi:T9SS type B sorting domain-containing protein [Hymenobacter puniceus]|uniref:T9SS type B sorting domain-containing protein n=1 Tax=Hymenobacter sp. BT190 TaxID=2763505 RepID=UPI001650D60C|nr:gliding motility-associated C-terminal domain-containing protein [Hymenobacter sp. BT190]MBC6698411.1 gliding motility-associated C-terminal domain-containing protein [Hymenobacter sp. BT190]